MLRTAAGGRRLLVPGGCGGSFLSMTDFAQATRLALCNPRAFGEVFNLGSDYVTWEEVARMVVRITGSPAGVEVVPPERWTGAAFLADPWQLDDRRVRERLGWRPECSPAGLRDQLESSIARTWAEEKAARP
jgi:nucleoside-diphosphate-sugar epimerase